MSSSLPTSIRHSACSTDEPIVTFQFGRILSTHRFTVLSTTVSMRCCAVPNTIVVLTSTIFVCPADTFNCIFPDVRVSIIEAPPFTALPVIVNICLLPPIIICECLILKTIMEFKETTPIFTNTVDIERNINSRQIVCINKNCECFLKHPLRFPFVEIPRARIVMIYLFALALWRICIQSNWFRWRNCLWKSRQGKILQLHRPHTYAKQRSLKRFNENICSTWWMCTIKT